MESKKRAGVAILVSNKTNIKPTKLKRDKEGHYKRINTTRTNDPNIYTPNTGAPRYIKQVLNDLQRDLDSHTIIVGHFNTPLSILDRSTRQKINKDIQDLNSDLEQVNSVNIHRALYFKYTKYTFATLNTQNIDWPLLIPIFF